MYSPASSSSSSSGASSPMGYSTSSATSTSSSSSTRSHVHAASLVDPARHPAVLLQLVEISSHGRLSVNYVVDCVSETVGHALGRTPSSSRGRTPTRSPYLPKFTTFVTTVLSRAEVTAPTLLTALVYVFRARPHLSVALEEWALERVFLGALIAASKYTNDSNAEERALGALYRRVRERDVGRIEREFLDVLDWELGVGEGGFNGAPCGAGYPTPAHEEDERPRTRALEPVQQRRQHVPAHPCLPFLLSPFKSGRFHDLRRSFPLPRSHTHHAHGRSFAIHVAA
ncbi:hypothetical protein DFH09DRAFT_1373021 [Mycena vulgaris]|nr:hypothetical protein DFH09DRAFT_1373021 [Mycena vulgaris]